MFEKFLSTLEECKRDRNIRAIFLSGEGDAFSAGGDVKDMATKVTFVEKLKNENKTLRLEL